MSKLKLLNDLKMFILDLCIVSLFTIKDSMSEKEREEKEIYVCMFFPIYFVI